MGLELGRFVLQTFMRVLGFVKTSSSKENFVLRVWANYGVRIKEVCATNLRQVLGFVKTSSKIEGFVLRVWDDYGFRIR